MAPYSGQLGPRSTPPAGPAAADGAEDAGGQCLCVWAACPQPISPMQVHLPVHLERGPDGLPRTQNTMGSKGSVERFISGLTRQRCWLLRSFRLLN